MKSKSLICLLLLLVSGFQLLKAQIKPSFHFTEDDGLAGNMVKDIIMDKGGILWIATDNGISKFDGESFENMYKTDGLPSNRVWALATDRDRIIYAGCYQSGLAVIRNDSIVNTFHLAGKYPNSFRKLYYSNYYHKLIVGTDDGIYILQNNNLIPVRYNKDTTEKSIITSISGEDSKIFFSVLKGKSLGLYELFLNNKSIEKSYGRRISPWGRFATMIEAGSLFSSEYNHIFKQEINKLWEKPMKISADTSLFIWCMKPYKDGKFWAGGLGDGRFRGDILMYDIQKNKVEPSGIRQNIQTVNAILYDPSSGVTWFGRDNGLTAYRESPFEYTDFNGKENIIDIGFAGDSLLILTENGVYFQDRGKVIPILTKQQVTLRITSEWNKQMKRNGEKFHKLFDTSRGCEFASFTQDNGRLFINTAMGAISVPNMKTYLPFGVGAFKLRDDGGAYSSVNYIPLRDYKSIEESIDYTDLKDESGTIKDVFEIIESKGVYFFATHFEGLYAIKDNKVFRLRETNLSVENSLTDIDKDIDDNVWCTTGNGKLFQIGFSNKPYIIRELDLSNCGLIGNNCKWLKFNRDYLYIGTNKGLNIIASKSLNSAQPSVVYFYNSYNGYDFASAISPVIGRKGELFVHTLNEIIRIDTNLIRNSFMKLDVSKVHINDRKADLIAFDSRTLPYSINQISFLFRVIKYPFSKNISYRYKINNEGWILGNQVNLHSLRAGRYVIQIEAFDKETLRKVSDSITFSIQKPYWQTYWFLIIVITSLILISYMIIRFRFRLLRRRQEEKSKLLIQNSELQLRSLQIQMNPHFIFNALTSIQNFIIMKNVKDSLSYLGSLASIIRTNLENATKEYVVLSDEIEFLNKYIQIERIRFKDKLQIELIDNTTESKLLIPPMLIQPVIENSIKHGIRNRINGGIVTVVFTQEERALIVSIQDNGIGRESAKKLRTSENKEMGVNIISNRLNLLNEIYHTDIHTIEFIDLYSDKIPAGTRVVIKLLRKLL